MVLAKKSLGQNFLMHAQTAERIVGASMLPDGATVLEIGPGTGMLTRALLSHGAHVIAVEADASLVPALETTFAAEIAQGSLTLISADIRSFDTAMLPPAYHIVANIPYYITGELLRRFLSDSHKPRSMTFLVQKEVAERITRDPKGSLLSMAVKAYGTPIYRFTVPRGAFKPAPNVDSAVLSITDIHGDFASPEEEAWFFEVLRTGFGHKRKQLLKNLEALVPREKVREALNTLALSPTIRAEDLSLSQWKALAPLLHA